MGGEHEMNRPAAMPLLNSRACAAASVSELSAGVTSTALKWCSFPIFRSANLPVLLENVFETVPKILDLMYVINEACTSVSLTFGTGNATQDAP